MTPRRIACACALVVALANASVRADEGQPADIAVARELFRQGSQLAGEGRWEEALVRYQKSLALKRAPITLYSLGVACKELGRYVEASESFRAFLAEPSVEATRPYEKPAREAIAELQPKLAHLLIRVVGAEGATLLINGVTVATQAMGERRPVDPGKHTLLARAPGFVDKVKEITIASGETMEIDLALERAPVAPVDAPPVDQLVQTPRSVGDTSTVVTAQPDVTLPPAEAPSLVAPWSLVGVGAGVFAAGVIVGAVGIVEADTAPSRESPEADAALGKTIAGDVLGAVGLASAAAGVIWLIVEATRSHPTQAAWTSIEARPDGLRIRF